MVGPLNNGFQQQSSVLNVQKPAFADDAQARRNTAQNDPNQGTINEAAQTQTVETNNTSSINADALSNDIQSGIDNGLLTQSDARGNTLDISV